MALQKDNLKILLIQFRPAGDVLLLTSAVKAIKKGFPESELTFMVNEKESGLIRNFPLIDNFILIDKIPKDSPCGFFRYLKYNISLYCRALRSDYDAVIDFIGNPKSAIFTFLTRARFRIGRNLKGRRLAYNNIVPEYTEGMNTIAKRLSHLKPLGIDAEYVSPEIFFSESEILFADNYLASLNIEQGKKIIFLAPNSPRSSRRWKGEYFIETGKILIKEHNAFVLVAWGPGEEEYTKNIVREIGKGAEMIPPTSLKEMAAIISKSDLMITNDSGPKHMANAAGVPTITIYGPTSPVSWNHPDREANPVLCADIPCIHCEQNICPLEKHLCMERVLPEHVLETVSRIFK